MPFPPERRFPVIINQVKIVVHNVLHQFVEQPDSLIFYRFHIDEFGNGAKHKHVSNGFVAAGSGFPVPLWVGGILPALGIRKNIDVATALKRTRRKSRYRIYGVKPFHGIQRFNGILQCFFRLGNCIPENLAAEIHGGPKPVVIGVVQIAGGQISVCHST